MSKTVNNFEVLNQLDVSNKVEKKNGLSYLSWSWAWGSLLKLFPTSTYKVYENQQEWNYFSDGRTAWVKVGVTVESLEHIEMLPVMDFRNKSIIMDKVTSFDVNKAIQRALTKAIARHGLGLYIYAGEDLPEDSEKETPSINKGRTSVPNKNISNGTNSSKNVQSKTDKDIGYTPESVKIALELEFGKKFEQEDMKCIFNACNKKGIHLINDFEDKEKVIYEIVKTECKGE